ncbi:unnamed protein product, partial [Rotaria sp. Silwood1]
MILFRRSRYTRISPEPQPIATTHQSLPLDHSHTSQSFTMNDTKFNQILSTASTVLPSNIIDSNSLPDRTKMTTHHLPTPNVVEQQNIHLSDSLNNLTEDIDINPSNNSPPSNSLLKNNLSTPDLDPYECKKQTALAKAEAKLEKAQHLHQLAQHSVEQSISEFLRATTMPSISNESNSQKTIIATFEQRIRTLQETKKKLEKKITKYQSDVTRIQAGDIPQHYRSSKDIFPNFENKVPNGSDKNCSTNNISTPVTHDQTISSSYPESDNHHAQLNLPSTSTNHNIETMNNYQSFLSFSHNSSAFETKRSSPSSSISNGIGTSQSYINSNSDVSAIHDVDRSPSAKRRSTDDSNIEVIDRYDAKMGEMQKQMDSLILINNSQNERNERLNNELTDLTDLHQNEISTIKIDSRKLEEKLLYNLNEYWTEIIERLDKIDTRTTKVEQTQAHSFETEENTHRLISKLVNILLTVFAIILLLLSTIKNLLQSRVHAIILLIFVFTWIIIHYLPENYFQLSFIQ